MVLLGLDDTDGVGGGCTTHVAARLVATAGADLVGPPRLVRLNPNIPHRTRGNGAVALRFGHGRGTPQRIGEWGGRPLLAYPEAEGLTEAETEALFQQATRLVAESARLEEPATHPAVVMVRAPPPEPFYRAAVHRYVGLREADEALAAAGARWAAWKAGRGRLGAMAALAWPGTDGTYEAIAYRKGSRRGTRRPSYEDVAAALDAEHPETFDNWDPVHRHVRIAPSTPCPVLVGVRATRAAAAMDALDRVAAGAEEPEGQLLFWTNQATDDHRTTLTIDALRPFLSATVEAEVVRDPEVRPGGHVFVRLRDPTGTMDAAAFEPTKGFRAAVRALRRGDAVRVHGGLHEDPSLLGLERLDLVAALPRTQRRAPRCGPCDRRMASRGRAAGYRCERCGARRSGPEWSLDEPPAVASYEVPVMVRRHLARPLRLRPLAAA